MRVTQDGQESTHYGRLCRLITELGTSSVRHYVLTNLCPERGGLDGTLRALRERFDKLLKKKSINNEQFDILFPHGNNNMPKIDMIDLTLWTVLARNATSLTASGWIATLENDNITGPKKAICIIKTARNELFHRASHRMEALQFERIWLQLRASIVLLNPDAEAEIDRLKTEDLDNTTTEKCIIQLERQQLVELKIKAKRDGQKRVFRLVVEAVLTILLLLGVALAAWFITNRAKSCLRYAHYIATNAGIIVYEPRIGWGAKPSTKPLDPLRTPVKYVIISHTDLLAQCLTIDECCTGIAQIQDFNMRISEFFDIAFNYLIGDSGVLFEGRGSDMQSATARHWNNVSISFAFTGLFERRLPSEEALSAVQAFLVYLVKTGKLQKDYILYGLCQVRPFPYSPGAALYEELTHWKHWRPRNDTSLRCIPNQSRNLEYDVKTLSKSELPVQSTMSNAIPYNNGR